MPFYCCTVTSHLTRRSVGGCLKRVRGVKLKERWSHFINVSSRGYEANMRSFVEQIITIQFFIYFQYNFFIYAQLWVFNWFIIGKTNCRSSIIPPLYITKSQQPVTMKTFYFTIFNNLSTESCAELMSPALYSITYDIKLYIIPLKKSKTQIKIN